jgi:hypothetical protein
MYDTKSQRIFLYNLQKEFHELVTDNYYAPLNLQSETILKVFSKDHNKTKSFVQQNKSIYYQKDVIDYLIQTIGINPSELLFLRYNLDNPDNHDYIIQRIKNCNCIIPDKIMKKYMSDIYLTFSWFCYYPYNDEILKIITQNAISIIRTLFQYGGNPFLKYDRHIVDTKWFTDTVCKAIERVLEHRRKWVIRCITSFQQKYRERYYRPNGKGFELASNEFNSLLIVN